MDVSEENTELLMKSSLGPLSLWSYYTTVELRGKLLLELKTIT